MIDPLQFDWEFYNDYGVQKGVHKTNGTVLFRIQGDKLANKAYFYNEDSLLRNLPEYDNIEDLYAAISNGTIQLNDSYKGNGNYMYVTQEDINNSGNPFSEARFWWDMSNTSNLELDETLGLTTISKVIDKTTNNIDLTQTTKSNQPEFRANGGFNNAGHAYFDGTDKSLLSDVVSLGDEYTLYIVYLTPDDTLKGVIGPNPSNVVTCGANGVQIVNDGSLNRYMIYPGIWNIISFHKNSTGVTCRLNGVPVNPDSVGISGQTYSPSGLSNVSGFPFGGGISEVIGKDYVENDIERRQSEDYLFNKYGILSYRMFVFGDSWTAGVGASPLNTRWSTVLAGMLGSIEINLARSGSVLQNTSPTEQYNFRDQYIDRVSGPVTPNDILIIMYGINDIRFNNVNYTPETFETDYSEIITGILAKGWLPSKIILCSQSKIDASASVTPPFNGYSQARHEAHNAKIQSVAASFGCKYADVYTAMQPNGIVGETPDGIHPNSTSANTIATIVYNTINT